MTSVLDVPFTLKAILGCMCEELDLGSTSIPKVSCRQDYLRPYNETITHLSTKMELNTLNCAGLKNCGGGRSMDNITWNLTLKNTITRIDEPE